MALERQVVAIEAQLESERNNFTRRWAGKHRWAGKQCIHLSANIANTCKAEVWVDSDLIIARYGLSLGRKLHAQVGNKSVVILVRLSHGGVGTKLSRLISTARYVSL